jgi:hypothetical protein
MPSHTARHAAHGLHDIRLFHGAGPFGMAIVVALTSAVALRAWPGATLTLRTIARIAMLYLGNARG